MSRISLDLEEQDHPDSLRQYVEYVDELPYYSMDEVRQLAERSIAGDEEAFQQLVQTKLRNVCSVVLRVCSNSQDDIWDRIQEGNLVLVRVLRNISKSDPEYLTSRIAQEVRRAASKSPQESEFEPVNEQASSTISDPYIQVKCAEAFSKINILIEKETSIRNFEVWEARGYAGWFEEETPYRELSRRFGITTARANQILTSVKSALKRNDVYEAWRLLRTFYIQVSLGRDPYRLLSEIESQFEQEEPTKRQAREHSPLFSSVLKAHVNRRQRREHFLDTPLKELGVGSRACNILRRKRRVSTVRDLLESGMTSEAELLDIHNFGRQALEDLREKLMDYGIEIADSYKNNHERQETTSGDSHSAVSQEDRYVVLHPRDGHISRHATKYEAIIKAKRVKAVTDYEHGIEVWDTQAVSGEVQEWVIWQEGDGFTITELR